ncbi:hypothetical protein CHUAL_000948 [Chamberlinius hualienensis]
MSDDRHLCNQNGSAVSVKRLKLSLKSHRNYVIKVDNNLTTSTEARINLNVTNDSSIANKEQSQKCSVMTNEKDTLSNSRELNEISVYITSLKNLGNTCYLNSVIYCLLYIKEFRKIVHEAFVKLQLTYSESKQFQVPRSSDDVVLQLHEIFQQMIQIRTYSKVDVESSRSKLITFHTIVLEPVKLLNSLRTKYSMFEGHFQNDAHDALSCIMQCLETVDSKFKKSRTKSPQSPTEDHLSDMFQGELLMKTKCLECECWSTTKEEFTEISIAPASSNLDFESALKMEEILRDDEKYWCQECHHRNEAVRACEYLKFPPILTINMKPCFMQHNSLDQFQKTSIRTAVPDEISCLNNTCLTKPCTNKSHKFFLLALICHIGSSLSFGHFTCYIRGSVMFDKVDANIEGITGNTDKKIVTRNVARKNRIIESLNFECCDPPKGPKIENDWVYFDDEYIKVVPSLPKFGEGVRSETPYLLFYRNMDEMHSKYSKNL